MYYIWFFGAFTNVYNVCYECYVTTMSCVFFCIFINCPDDDNCICQRKLGLLQTFIYSDGDP